MKTYKHKIYLVERTKLLEGFLCQSLTFTNGLGRPDGRAEISALTFRNVDIGIVSSVDEYDADVAFGESIYKTPIKTDTLVVKTPYNIKMYLQSQGTTSGISIYSASVTLTYTIDGVSTTITDSDTTEYYLEISTKNVSTIGLKYTCDASTTYNSGAFGTDKFEYQYVFAVGNEKYPLVRWTIRDVINRILDLAEPILTSETPRYTLNPPQAEKYSKIFAPEFTMTQCTLREQLKIIGGYIHAEPRLGGYYNGVYQENMIFFDEYGTEEESFISNSPYVYKGNSQNIAEYCTDVQTNATNIVNSLDYAQGVIIDPYSNADRTLRTESINVKLSESTSKAYTQLPIYKVTKVECGLYNPDMKSYQIEPVDITPYVYESYEYNSVLSSYGGAYPYSKSFGIYYTQGQKGLDGLFFKNENAVSGYWSEYTIVNILNEATGGNWKDEITTDFPYLTFRVSYLPIYEAKFSHNKQLVIKGNKKFSQIYNQSENLIETTYYGENIKGVAQRLGNVEQTRTYIFKNHTLIPKIGQSIDGFKISAVNTEIQWGYIKCTIALSKDFNRISQYVGINSNKRIAEVSERQAYKRDILIKDYVVIGDQETQNARCFSDTKFVINSLLSKSNLENLGIDEIKQISCAIGLGRTKNDTLLNIVRLPVISSAFGNSMLFSWNYKDNYSAGEQVQPYLYNDNGNKLAMWQTDVPYCDYYGRIWKYNFRLFNELDFYNSSTEDYKQALTTETASTISTEPVFGLGNSFYLLRKDSRESLSFNYEIEFVTNREDLIIGSAMASNNPLVCGRVNEDTARVYFLNRKINKFENEINPDDVVADQSINVYNDTVRIVFNIPDVDFESWVICTPTRDKATEYYQDEDGNVISVTEKIGGKIMLSSIKSKADYSTNTETIYFTGRKNIYD